jgi:hypothetical protein
MHWWEAGFDGWHLDAERAATFRIRGGRSYRVSSADWWTEDDRRAVASAILAGDGIATAVLKDLDCLDRFAAEFMPARGKSGAIEWAVVQRFVNDEEGPAFRRRLVAEIEEARRPW